MKVGIDSDGRQYQEKRNKQTGKVYKYYLDEGKIAEDYWIDIETLNRGDKERLGYPTQKPEALLERIIKTSSNPRDVVLDAYCGSGTTVAVSQRLSRRWIGIDFSYESISLTLKRLEDAFGQGVLEQVEQFESQVKTLEVLSDGEFIANLEAGVRQAKAGETITLEELEAELGF